MLRYWQGCHNGIVYAGISVTLNEVPILVPCGVQQVVGFQWICCRGRNSSWRLPSTARCKVLSRLPRFFWCEMLSCSPLPFMRFGFGHLNIFSKPFWVQTFSKTFWEQRFSSHSGSNVFQAILGANVLQDILGATFSKPFWEQHFFETFWSSRHSERNTCSKILWEQHVVQDISSSIVHWGNSGGARFARHF